MCQHELQKSCSDTHFLDSRQRWFIISHWTHSISDLMLNLTSQTSAACQWEKLERAQRWFPAVVVPRFFLISSFLISVKLVPLCNSKRDSALWGTDMSPCSCSMGIYFYIYMYTFIQCLYISVDIYIAYRGRGGVKGGCQHDLAEQMRHNLFSAFRHTIILEEIRLAKADYRYPSLVWTTTAGHWGSRPGFMTTS